MSQFTPNRVNSGWCLAGAKHVKGQSKRLAGFARKPDAKPAAFGTIDLDDGLELLYKKRYKLKPHGGNSFKVEVVGKADAIVGYLQHAIVLSIGSKRNLDAAFSVAGKRVLNSIG